MRSFLNRDVGAQVSKICSKRRLWNLAKRFARATEWLFIGCGSSYYVALSAAATIAHLTGLRARALPASEILFHQDIIPAGAENCVPALISRSGGASARARTYHRPHDADVGLIVGHPGA